MTRTTLIWTCVGVAVIGMSAYAFRSQRNREAPAPSGLDHAPACDGDRDCAVQRADALLTLAKDAQIHSVASPLKRSLLDSDCDAATELAGALARIDVDRAKAPEVANSVDRALLGCGGYCSMTIMKMLDPPAPDATISLDRGPCVAHCPAYLVTVRGDGEVTFVGKDFVAKKGTSIHRIGAPRARELFDAFERLGFAKKKPSYGEGVPVTGGVTLTLSRGPVPIRVIDNAPELSPDAEEASILYLEHRTDEIAETDQYVTAQKGH